MLRSVFDFIGRVTLFGAKALRDAWVPPFEGEYPLKQVYEIGVGSFALVVAFDMTKLLEQAQGIMIQANTSLNGVQGTMTDVNRHLDTALDTATGTMKNVNSVVLDVRNGKGAAGLLLDPGKRSCHRRAGETLMLRLDNSKKSTVNL